MSENSNIAWTDATFNPWWGCTKHSPGCLNCYAEAFDKRTGGDHFGKGKPRRTFGDKHWAEPFKWNRKAEKDGVRRRVFCGSMCDWCDEEAPEGQRERLWNTIRMTPNLDWLLLTKRADRIVECLPSDWGDGWSNVWQGVTVEDQAHLHRAITLAHIPAVVHFVSFEPLIGPVNTLPLMDSNRGLHWWWIVGGESGGGRRKFLEGWALDLLIQAREYGAAYFFKQIGGLRPGTPPTLDCLNVREFPL